MGFYSRFLTCKMTIQRTRRLQYGQWTRTVRQTLRIPLKSVATVVLLIFLNTDSLAREEKELLLLFSDPWPPYIQGAQDPALCGGGRWIELIDTIFERVEGYRVNCALKPWARVLDEARSGITDGVILLGKTKEREQYLEYVDWLTTNRVVVWYSVEHFPKGLEWETMNDFQGLIIGKIRKSINGKEFVAARENGLPLEIYETVHELQLYRMLLAGRIDVAAIPELIAIGTIKKNGWEKRLTRMKKPLARDRLFFAFSKKSEASRLVPKINTIIREMKKNGMIDKILSGKQ